MDITTSYLPHDLQFRIVPFEGKTDYDSMQLHRHNYTEIFIFLNGGGTHLIDFTEYKIKANEVHFVFPHHLHLVKRSEKAHGFVVLFKADFLEVSSLNPMQAFANSYFHNPVLSLSDSEFLQLENVFNLIQAEFKNNEKDYSDSMLKYYLNAFLLHCLRYKNGKEQGVSAMDEIHSLCNKFRKMVDTNYRQHQNLTFYQNELGVSYKKLSSSIKTVLGKSAKQLLDERLNLGLRRELMYKVKSIKEIAYDFGFSEHSNFSKFFKRMNDCSAAEFKSHWSKKYKP